jgi:lysophospholipase L1-like esterase
VPLEEFESNLTEIVSIFRTSHLADVLLMTPSTISVEMVYRDFAAADIPRPESYVKSNELQRKYADAVLRVGERTGSPVVDLYKTFEERSFNQDDLFTDGTHYTRKGYAVSEKWLIFLHAISADYAQPGHHPRSSLFHRQ